MTADPTKPIVISAGTDPCPRCGGTGSVSCGPDPYTGSSTILTCDLCFGAKVKSVALHPAKRTIGAIALASLMALAAPADALELRAPDSLRMGFMLSDHGDGCKGCRETHPQFRLQWDEGWGVPWADLTMGAFINSVDKPSYYVGAALHRPIFGDSGLEAVMHVGLHTGYDHMTGMFLSPLALPGIRYESGPFEATLMGAPLFEKGGNVEPFFVLSINMTVASW